MPVRARSRRRKRDRGKLRQRAHLVQHAFAVGPLVDARRDAPLEQPRPAFADPRIGRTRYEIDRDGLRAVRRHLRVEFARDVDRRFVAHDRDRIDRRRRPQVRIARERPDLF